MNRRSNGFEVVPCVWRGCLVLMACMMMTTFVHADKIAFATDRSTADDFDVWYMQPDGSSQTEVTSESGDARNPSVTPDGYNFVYDHGDDLWMVDKDGSNLENLTDLTSGPCSGSDLCNDPDAGPRFNAENDYRIVFTRTYVDTGQAGSPTITEIWMATLDVSARSLGSFYQITDIVGAALPQLEPTWCGSDHVLWSRSSPQAGFYEREICVVEVGSTGPVGSPTCYFGESSDTEDDIQPACSLDATQIAWTRGAPYSGGSDIWIMDCIDLDDDGNQFDDCDTAGRTNLTDRTDTDLHPTFNLAGTHVALTSFPSDGYYYSIWTVETSGNNLEQRTFSHYDNIDPDWGPN